MIHHTGEQRAIPPAGHSSNSIPQGFAGCLLWVMKHKDWDTANELSGLVADLHAGILA